MSALHRLCRGVPALLCVLQLDCAATAQPPSGDTARETRSARVDDSVVRQFWVVCDFLRGDREPAAADWDALFATPGYAALEAREHRRKTLTEAFRLAYMPSRAADRERAMAKGGWIAYVLPHLTKVPEARADLDAFRARLGRESGASSDLRASSE